MSCVHATFVLAASVALVLSGYDNGSEAGWWQVQADFGALYIPAERQSTPDANAQMGKYSPGSYDPRQLMPLAVGNKWVYRWKSSAVIGGGEVRREAYREPLFMHAEFYILGEYMQMMHARSGRARNHEETYTIVRQDGDHYFFEISSDPHVDQGQLRDGRFAGSIENAWTWTDNTFGVGKTRSLVLTESIKRKSDVGFAYMLEGMKGMPEARNLDAERTILADHRMVLFVPFLEGRWAYSRRPSHYEVGTFSAGHDFRAGTYSMKYDLTPKTMVVPAGTFQGCFETIEYGRTPSRTGVDKSKDSQVLLYRTHTFWAPGTGIVREYQEFADGKIAFERELISFAASGSSTKSHAERVR